MFGMGRGGGDSSDESGEERERKARAGLAGKWEDVGSSPTSRGLPGASHSPPATIVWAEQWQLVADGWEGYETFHVTRESALERLAAITQEEERLFARGPVGGDQPGFARELNSLEQQRDEVIRNMNHVHNQATQAWTSWRRSKRASQTMVSGGSALEFPLGRVVAPVAGGGFPETQPALEDEEELDKATLASIAEVPADDLMTQAFVDLTARASSPEEGSKKKAPTALSEG
jgi:hypothetical protein